MFVVGRESSVGIATRYWSDGPGIESRWGRHFPHPSRTTHGSTQPPIQWVPDLFPGVKRPGRGVEHPPHLAPRLKKELPLWAFVACFTVTFTFTFTSYSLFHLLILCVFSFHHATRFTTLHVLHSSPKVQKLQNTLIAATHCYRKAHSPQTGPSLPISVPFPSRGSLCYPDDAGSKYLRNIAVVPRGFENQCGS